MHTLLLLMAAIGADVETGWHPLPEGGIEYVVQLEPSVLEDLKDGGYILGKMPMLLDVKQYRIVVGHGRVDRIDPAPPPSKRAEKVEPASNPFRQPFDGLDDAPLYPRNKPLDLPPPPVKPLESTAPDFDFPEEQSPNRRAQFEQRSSMHEMDRPSLPEGHPLTAAAPRPWLPLVISLVLLCVSLGTNLYLGWNFVETRARLRKALLKVRVA